MKSRLHIVADQHIWGVQDAFAQLDGYDVVLDVCEQQNITATTVRHADVLLTRSSTKVGQALLANSSVRFAATATIGDDHYDKTWLDTQGILWANAAGSSTESVVEYILTALLELHQQHYLDLHTLKLGIIGVGRIGSRLLQICNDMEVQTLLNDPPRQRQQSNLPLLSLDDVLQQADVLTLHTPLVVEGEDCTRHLLDAMTLARFKGRGIINAARGSCVDEQALLDWLDGDKQRWVVLDCWEHEPDILYELLLHPQVCIATPHIAGHSLDGKAANTQYIYDALCDFLGIQKQWHMQQLLPQINTKTIKADNLFQAIQSLYPIMHDVQALKKKKAFTDQRRHYPVRRAWRYFCLDVMPFDDGHLQQVCHAVSQHMFLQASES